MRGTHECELIRRDEWEEWGKGDDEDVAVANACLAVEREVRDAEWNALGLLDLAYHAPEVKLPAATAAEDTGDPLPPLHSVVLVSRQELATAAMYALGWHRGAPERE